MSNLKFSINEKIARLLNHDSQCAKEETGVCNCHFYETANQLAVLLDENADGVMKKTSCFCQCHSLDNFGWDQITIGCKHCYGLKPSKSTELESRPTQKKILTIQQTSDYGPKDSFTFKLSEVFAVSGVKDNGNGYHSFYVFLSFLQKELKFEHNFEAVEARKKIVDWMILEGNEKVNNERSISKNR